MSNWSGSALKHKKFSFFGKAELLPTGQRQKFNFAEEVELLEIYDTRRR